MIARTLVDHQASADQFNQYVIGMQWLGLALFVPLALGQAVFPRLIEKDRAGELSPAAILKPAAFTVAVVMGIALLATLGTPLLQVVYGPEYPFSRWFVLAVLSAAALGGAVNLLGYYIMARHSTEVWFGINLTSVAISSPILLLSPPETAFAAALILCLCYGGVCLAALLTIGRGPGKREQPI
jgi:O-antigen/teichoic acid export membrane protein